MSPPNGKLEQGNGKSPKAPEWQIDEDLSRHLQELERLQRASQRTVPSPSPSSIDTPKPSPSGSPPAIEAPIPKPIPWPESGKAQASPSPAETPHIPIVPKPIDVQNGPEADQLLEQQRRDSARRVKDHENSFARAMNLPAGAITTAIFGGRFELPNPNEAARLSAINGEMTRLRGLPATTLGAEADIEALQVERQAVRTGMTRRGQWKTIGMLGASWGIESVLDGKLFPDDQNLEYTMAADWIAGPVIACSRGPWYLRMAGILGTHLMAKYADHSRQQQVEYDPAKERREAERRYLENEPAQHGLPVPSASPGSPDGQSPYDKNQIRQRSQEYQQIELENERLRRQNWQQQQEDIKRHSQDK